MTNTSNPYESPKSSPDEQAALEKRWGKWRQVRARGRRRFVWVNGVVGWGIPTAILWSIWMGYSIGWNRTVSFLISALIFFPIGGYFWGAWMWYWMERSYKKAFGTEQAD
jgi:hypothetical protein